MNSDDSVPLSFVIVGFAESGDKSRLYAGRIKVGNVADLCGSKIECFLTTGVNFINMGKLKIEQIPIK